MFSPVPMNSLFELTGSSAIAPHARLAERAAVGFWSNASIFDAHVAPPSSERKTPPTADATYTRVPPPETANAGTRPLTAGRFEDCPRRITDGPIGVQLFVIPGPGGS